jgi:hypothetical protein
MISTGNTLSLNFPSFFSPVSGTNVMLFEIFPQKHLAKNLTQVFTKMDHKIGFQ